MAGFPAPSVGRDHFSELLYLIKNTEYENSQQLQSIEQEREKIARLKTELEDKLRDCGQREKSGSAAEEQSEVKEKRLVYLKENCDSLKHTALVLEEHQAALRKKLQLKQEEYHTKREHHSELLSKYRGIWERYEAKYQARPLATEVAQRRKMVEDTRRKVQEQSDDIAGLEKQIASLQLVHGQELPAEAAQWKCQSQIVSEIADLFVKRDRAYGQLEDKGSYLEQLNADISALEEKVKKQQHQEKDKLTQQGGAGQPPAMAPSAPSESLTTGPHTPSTAEGGSRVVGGAVQQQAQPPPVHCTPVLQGPLQRPAPPSLSLNQRAHSSVPPVRAPTRPSSLFTLPSLISPLQPQRPRTVLPSTSRGHAFTPNTTPAKPQQLPKPPSANRLPQRFPASNFQLVVPSLPKAPPSIGRGSSPPVQPQASPAATPGSAQPTNPSPQLEVSVFKCPKPVTRTPSRSMETPICTQGEPVTRQADQFCEQQVRREKELQAPAEAVVTEQPSVPAVDSGEMEVVSEGTAINTEQQVEVVSEDAAINTVQQVEVLDTACPQPALEGSGHESLMDFTAATTREQHEGRGQGVSSSPFNFGLSPVVQTQQQQILSPSQPANNPEGFVLCPSSNAALPDTPGVEGSGMAFLFGEGRGGETGGEGGIGLFQFEGPSSSQEHNTPADSGHSWSLFGGGGEAQSSQGEGFSFAFGGSPQTPRYEDSNTTSMFQF